LRVSFSAIVRVEAAGEYLLIRNLHRQEVFAPIGGVYKYAEAATVSLDALSFRQEHTAWPEDTSLDVRGFLPRRNALTFRRWFDAGYNRESGSECLRREFVE